MDDQLDTLDRATMATWRATNVLGWGAAALLAAVVIHQLADELAQRWPNLLNWSGGMNGRPGGPGATWQYHAPHYGYRAGWALFIGIIIGAVIGTKVWRRPTTVAAATALAYVVISTLLFEFSIVGRTETSPSGLTVSVGLPVHGLPRRGIEWSYSALALFAIAFATLVAWLIARRKAA